MSAAHTIIHAGHAHTCYALLSNLLLPSVFVCVCADWRILHCLRCWLVRSGSALFVVRSAVDREGGAGSLAVGIRSAVLGHGSLCCHPVAQRTEPLCIHSTDGAALGRGRQAGRSAGARRPDMGGRAVHCAVHASTSTCSSSSPAVWWVRCPSLPSIGPPTAWLPLLASCSLLLHSFEHSRGKPPTADSRW